jgi:hypothetical protein
MTLLPPRAELIPGQTYCYSRGLPTEPGDPSANGGGGWVGVVELHEVMTGNGAVRLIYQWRKMAR